MIKGLCVESGDNMAKIMFEGSTPLAGKYYYLEDITAGTGNQNRLFHALLTVFYNYMFETNTFKIMDQDIIYDLSSDCVESLKDVLKYKYGRGFKKLKYVDNNYCIKSVWMEPPKDKNLRDKINSDPGYWRDYDPWTKIPDYVIQDFNNGNRHRVEGKLWSWADYSMPQRHKLITKVFGFMDLFGVDSKKYDTIKQGLIDINEERLRQQREENVKNKNKKLPTKENNIIN